MSPVTKRPSYVTHDELAMIKQYLLLPLVLSVFERDIRQVKRCIKTPGPYMSAIQQAIEKVLVDTSSIRVEFQKRGIRVYEKKMNKESVSCSYQCRGYTGTMQLLMNSLKGDIETYMRNYLGVKPSTEWQT